MTAVASVALVIIALAHPELVSAQATRSSSAQSRATAARPVFPLDVGRRWTYVHDDRDGLILEVVAPRAMGRVRYQQIRVRGPSLFWHDEALLVAADAMAFRIVGGVYQDEVMLSAPSYDALRLPSHVGDAWVDHSEFLEHRTQVLAIEDITVPAGRYTATRVRYVRTDLAGDERDFDVWFAAGVGIVRVEFWQSTNTRGTTPISPPERYDLSQIAIVSVPRRLSGATLPPRPIAVSGRIATAHAIVGEPVQLEFRIANRTRETLALLPSLDGSDVGWRVPRITVELRDEHGPVSVSPGGRCGNSNELRVNDFVAVPPGGSFDVLGPGSFRHWILEEWRPSHPGRYTARLIYDLGGHADRREVADPELRTLLNAMPRGRFESPLVEFDVEPAPSPVSQPRTR